VKGQILNVNKAMHQASELLFEGKIPAEFSIVESDVTSVKIPIPYYALLSRVSYLSLETTEVVNHFKGSVIELDQSIWFECNGQPLKSHLPIGVLYDFFCKEISLPWRIVIHFRQFPGNKLIRSSTVNDTEKLFSHSLKQSVFLLSGNTRLFTSLSIQKQTDLHQSVSTVDCQLYKDVMEEVLSGVTSSSTRSLPVAIVVSDGRPVIQRPVSVFSEVEKPSMSTVIEQAPDTLCIDEEMTEVNNGGDKNTAEELEATITSSGHDIRSTEQIEDMSLNMDSIRIDTGSNNRFTTLQDVITDAFRDSDVRLDDIKDVLIQGIPLPREASIFEIWERFCHLDLFLYIVVHI